MICFTLLALLVISAVSGQHTYDRTDYVNEEPLLFDKFPEGFQWGAATSAHQVSITRHVTYAMPPKRVLNRLKVLTTRTESH